MICLAVGLTIASLQPALADTLRWFSAGRPTTTAHQAVDLLASAADDGLDANDYDAEPAAQSHRRREHPARLFPTTASRKSIRH